MERRTVLTDNGFCKCSWAHAIISFTQWCRFLMQCRLRDQRSRTFNVGFRPCRLHGESSPDSVNLLIMLWTVDDEIPKFPAIERWETLFLNCWTIFLCSRSQSRDPRLIFACEQLSLLRMLHLNPIMTLTCFQLIRSPVECSKQMFFEHSSTFSVFCCPCLSFFEMCCRHPFQNEQIFAQKQ